MENYTGLGKISPTGNGDFIPLEQAAQGDWVVGRDGVRAIFTPRDRKVEFICFGNRTLVHVKSAMGHPAYYPLLDAHYESPAEAVLMDLDGTTVTSEDFWVWIIAQSIAALTGNPRFDLEPADLPHVSGHSVSEHLQHCIEKYCPDKTVEEARRCYFEATTRELAEISAGRGHHGAFKPTAGLKEFLLAAKGRGVRLGLVTSGLYEKAWPAVVSVFRTLELGDPLEFYDAIITAGFALRRGQVGTLGELSPKPHPWLYAETARVGLGLDPSRRHRVLGFEDSSAGVLAIRLAGFAAVGVPDGNIAESGVTPLLHSKVSNLEEAIGLL